MDMSLYEMMQLRNESVRNLQNKIYSDHSKWHIATLVKPSARLKCALRYSKILQIYGVLKTDTLMGNLKILEPGCGIGALSTILTILGEIFSFDYSEEGIKIAAGLFGDNKSINFFEGDGISPGAISELSGKRFDFILIREFYPFTRIIADNPKPIEVIREYYNMLSNKGVIIIEHALEINTWRKYDNYLQTSKIIKEFKALMLDTFSLDLILNSPFIFKKKRFALLLSRLLHPFIVMLCLMTTGRISKTIIIVR